MKHKTGIDQMICITIYKTPDKLYRGLRVIGHADSVEEGADLVCCSVSVLTINLINSLEQLTEDGFRMEEDEETGLIEISFDGRLSEEADLLMRSYDLGIHSIALEYETWLNVKTKEV